MHQHSKLKTFGARTYRRTEKILINYRKISNNTDNKKFNLESLRHETTQFPYKLRLAIKLQHALT